jgi:RNA polymerase sigma-70 factor, ECF subfamily
LLPQAIPEEFRFCRALARLVPQENDQEDTKMIESAPSTPESDAVLIRRVQLGERELFYELVQPYLGRLYRIVRPLLRNHADAEDVLQQTLLHALEHVDHLGSVRMFRAWLTQIAVNEVRMRWRRRNYRSLHYSIGAPIGEGETSSTLDLPDPREDPLEQFSRQELNSILRKNLERLPFNNREVFVLRELNQLSAEQTAQALGVTVSTVKTRLHRARVQLRRLLSPVLQRGDSTMPFLQSPGVPVHFSRVTTA